MRFKLSLFLLSLILAVSILMTSCGSDSRASVIDATINESGELILTYDNGEQQNLGVVVGAKGADGAAGAAGKDGTNAGKGADGKNGVDGADGKLVITTDGSSIPSASAKGLRSSVSISTVFNAVGGYGSGYGGSTTQKYSSAGSGVIYKMDRGEGDAYIITNYHVVYNPNSNTENGISSDIKVYLYGSEIEEKAIKATYVGGSLYYDIAVLHIDNSDILRESDAIAADIADSDLVRVGDSAIAIGNAMGYGISASVGAVCVDSEYINMIAADNKSIVSFRVMRFDTAVNSGNSGGGLYDDKGDLIGIVNAKENEDGVENIGYAIPSKVAVSVAENIIHYCKETNVERVQRAVIGVSMSASDSKAVYDSKTGAVTIVETISVSEITSGSLADGKFKVGDVFISATHGEKSINITRQFHVIDFMLDTRVGDKVIFKVLRDGVETTIEIIVTQSCLIAY